MKNSENKGTEKIGLVNPTPALFQTMSPIQYQAIISTNS